MVTEVSELRDPSPFRAALLGHLGKIHLSLEGYLRSLTDPLCLKNRQVGDSRKEISTRSFQNLCAKIPKLFPQKGAEQIKRTFNLYKEAIDHTLDDNIRRIARRELIRTLTRLLYLIGHELRPLIQKVKPIAKTASEAILNIENQTRAWHANLTQAWEQPSDAAKALTFENDGRWSSLSRQLYGQHEASAHENAKCQKNFEASVGRQQRYCPAKFYDGKYWSIYQEKAMDAAA